jgi:hypothetical protein
VLLAEETFLDLLSTLLVHEFKIHWAVVFCFYFIIAVVATALMILVKEYPRDETSQETRGNASQNTALYNATATVRLLVNDSKMKYMIGLNAAFGFAGAFLNSFVSGEVVPVALNDATASFVGLLVAFHGGTAAFAALGFGYLSRYGKGPILYFGAVCFALVA